MSYASVFLKLPSAEAAAAVRRALEAGGWAPFDPFAGYGRAYPQAVRAFAAPAQGDWTRLLCERPLDDALLRALAGEAVLIAAAADDQRAALRLGRDGTLSDLPLPDPRLLPAAPDRAPSAVFAALPPDLQALNTHPQAAEKMFARLSERVLGKAGGAGQSTAALALLRSDDVWATTAGRQLGAALSALGIADWAAPTFAEVRDAYSLARRRQRRPDARLLPGDEATLARVPEVLAYLPLYAGKG